jgi:putative SOS response-associated peptidase YedK
MCGRYTSFAAAKLIYEFFGIPAPDPGEDADQAIEIKPSWNVAPQTFQPVVRLNPDTGAKEVALMRWGLVPFFAESPVFNYSTINAKAETLLEKPAFRESFRRRRCLVPVDSYFEWQVTDPKKRTKHVWAIGMKSEKPFALGAIWDRWVSRDGASWIESYSIVTTETNELLAPLHERMPLIIPPQAWDRWLEPVDPQRPPVDLLRPFESDLMKCWRVKPDVGNVKNNRPDLVEPYDPAQDDPPSDPGDSPTLF